MKIYIVLVVGGSVVLNCAVFLENSRAIETYNNLKSYWKKEIANGEVSVSLLQEYIHNLS